MKDETKVLAGGSEEPGSPGSSEPKAKGSWSRRYGLEERKRLLAELEASGETMAAFCARHRVSTATICAWKRGFRTQGEAALVPRKPRGNPAPGSSTSARWLGTPASAQPACSRAMREELLKPKRQAQRRGADSRMSVCLSSALRNTGSRSRIFIVPGSVATILFVSTGQG